jgi:hypothetical protein
MEHFGAVTQLLPEAVLLLSGDAVIRAPNPAAAAKLPLEREKLIGWRPTDFTNGCSGSRSTSAYAIAHVNFVGPFNPAGRILCNRVSRRSRALQTEDAGG